MENKPKIEVAIKANIPVMLIGETGIGKTTLISNIAKEKGKRLTRISVNDQTGREDLVGKYTLVGGSMQWVDGALVVAMKSGDWIVLDELNAARPEVLFALHAVLDDAKEIVLNEKDNETVTAHADFRLFATMNPPTYRGTKNLNEAFMSRFYVVNMHGMNEVDEMAILQSMGINTDTISKIYNVVRTLRKLKDDNSIDFYCSTRDIVLTARLINAGMSTQDAINSAILNKISDVDQEITSGRDNLKSCEVNFKTVKDEIELLEQVQKEHENKLKDITKKVTEKSVTLKNITDEIDVKVKSLDEFKSKIEAEQKKLDFMVKEKEAMKRIIAKELLVAYGV